MDNWKQAHIDSNYVPKSKPNYADLLKDIQSIANECATMYAALPVAARAFKPRCSGLPRVYPKMWMGTPHSNSLMFEFREVQSLPSNGLRSWKV
jgi:hypothetical protein